MQNRAIEFPELRDSDITTYYAQRRPYREGGVRLEREQIKDKTIIHNYGHGGAGISIAPSCSYQAVSLAYDRLKPNAQVAVIGSGINGLMVAHRILQREPSCKVTIYAEDVASYCNKDNSKLITSEIAPGFWLPYKYGMTDQKLHQKLAHNSYEWYKAMSQAQLYKDYICQCDYYDLSDEQETDLVTDYITEDLRASLKRVEITINQKTKIICDTYQTYRIDLQPFLLVFKSQLINKGVKFIQRTLTPDSLLNLKENIIFNCSALGSRDLFNEKKMIPKKGHVIEYKNPNPEKYNYLLRINIGTKRIAYYMHRGRILAGLTIHEVDNKEIDPAVIAQIKEIHQQVLEKLKLFGPRAKL